MALQRIVHRSGYLGGPISDAATILLVDLTFLALVNDTFDFAGGDYFYMTIEEDGLIEEVKVTDSTTSYLIIERAQGPTDATAFSAAAMYNTDMTAAEIEERAAGLAPVAPLVLTPDGIVEIEEVTAGEYRINVPMQNITGQNGIEVTTEFPNTVIYPAPGSGCCGGDDEVPPGGGTDLIFIGGGITQVGVVDNTVTIQTPDPNFTGEGIDISGSWPDYTFNVPAGTGTVQVVQAGAGINILNDPNTDPEVNIANTGVTPGDYGGLVINARGQITEIPADYNPLANAVAASGSAITVGVSDGVATIGVAEATESTVGVVQLADSEAPLDPDDATTAVTPKMLADTIADIDMPFTAGGETYAGETDGDYTNTVATAALAVTLVSGQKAIVWVEVTARDSADTDPVEFGMAVFKASAGTRIQANKKMKQCNQSMMFGLEGPFSDAILVKTTALVGTENVVSHSVRAITF